MACLGKEMLVWDPWKAPVIMKPQSETAALLRCVGLCVLVGRCRMVEGLEGMEGLEGLAVRIDMIFCLGWVCMWRNFPSKSCEHA